MEQQIKQRLVGAVVLVALAVIFLPMILNGPAVSESGAIPRDVPPEPTPSKPLALTLSSAVAPTVLPVEGTPVIGEAAASPPPTPAAKAKPSPRPANSPKAAPRPSPKPAAKAKAASPVAWSVQVGSFTEREKAFRLRDRLRKARYATYVIEPKGGSRYFKVRVGPELEEARAREVMKRLAAEKKIKGFIVKHQ